MYVPELTYAKAANGKGVSINEVVKTDVQKSYFCPCCNEPVIARQGQKYAWSFAHKNNQDCAGALQTSLHLMAKDILSEAKQFYVPDIYTKEHWLYDSIYMPPMLVHVGGIISIDSVALECRTGDVVPDIVMTSNGKTFFVEIFVTHKIDEVKEWKLSELGISTIEIDLSKFNREISKDKLSPFLIGTCKEKYWIYNKIADERLTNLIRIRHKDFFTTADWGKPKEFLCVKAGVGFLLHKAYIGTTRKDGYIIENESGGWVYVDTIDFTDDGFEVYKCSADWDGQEEDVVFLPYSENAFE